MAEPLSHPLIDELLARCTFPAVGSEVVCAVSGGPDSTALLVLAVAHGCRVTAVHVDHGLRAGSSAEADVVAACAGRFGAAFCGVSVRVEPGPNLEARARAARRAALGPGALTGHTADDQAETVLVNLLRGAGVDGLAAMRPECHPLLGLRRSETHELCRELDLVVVTDPSNQDRRFLRNRVRAELLPLASDLAGRDLVPVLCRQAALLRDESDFLDGASVAMDVLDARALAAAPTVLARRAVRRWLRGEHPPDAASVERVLEVARGDTGACEVAGGERIWRSHQRLYRDRGAR